MVIIFNIIWWLTVAVLVFLGLLFFVVKPNKSRWICEVGKSEGDEEGSGLPCILSSAISRGSIKDMKRILRQNPQCRKSCPVSENYDPFEDILSKKRQDLLGIAAGERPGSASDPKKFDEKMRTALRAAIEEGDLWYAKILMKYGAEAIPENKDESVLFRDAVEKGLVTTAKLLCEGKIEITYSKR